MVQINYFYIHWNEFLFEELSILVHQFAVRSPKIHKAQFSSKLFHKLHLQNPVWLLHVKHITTVIQCFENVFYLNEISLLLAMYKTCWWTSWFGFWTNKNTKKLQLVAISLLLSTIFSKSWWFLRCKWNRDKFGLVSFPTSCSK